MNLLIVDDEIFAIKGILDSVDWKTLEFEEVLTAAGYAQAINMLKQKEVAVLLCDIEMPLGSGLELMEWMTEHSPDTQCIILSCHDEFSFARQAMLLHCVDYLLKPASPWVIEAALKKAAEAWKNKRRQELYVSYGKQYVSVSDQEGKIGSGKNDPVEDTVSYVRNHLAENLSVDMLAKRIYMNPEYLTRLFKKRYGKTLIEYITQERMTLAAEMLRNSDMTISMISAKTGYPNYSYFTKIFKKYFGVTPREYQQQ